MPPFHSSLIGPFNSVSGSQMFLLLTFQIGFVALAAIGFIIHRRMRFQRNGSQESAGAQRIRELEEQVKAIPMLKVRTHVWKFCQAYFSKLDLGRVNYNNSDLYLLFIAIGNDCVPNLSDYIIL